MGKSKYIDASAALQVIGCLYKQPSLFDDEGKYFFCEEDFTNDFIADEMLDREFPNPNHKGNRNAKWMSGWLDAINISLFILDDKYRGHLPYYAYEKYHWLAQYKPYIPYETWKNMTDEEKANHNWQTCNCCKKKFLADYEMTEDEVFHKKYCKECGKLLHIGGMV